MIKVKYTIEFVWHLLFHMTIVSLIACNRNKEKLKGFCTKSVLVHTEAGVILFSVFSKETSITENNAQKTYYLNIA